jgi:hypothetical protein
MNAINPKEQATKELTIINGKNKNAHNFGGTIVLCKDKFGNAGNKKNKIKMLPFHP